MCARMARTHEHTDSVCARLQMSNIFTVARRNVDDREMLYHSVKFCNGVWLLAELNLPGVNEPGGNAITVRSSLSVDE